MFKRVQIKIDVRNSSPVLSDADWTANNFLSYAQMIVVGIIYG